MSNFKFGSMVMSEWRTIDTAPKGKTVLLYEPAVASGRNQLPARIVVERWPTTYPRKASHWMAVPPPPAAEA